MTDLSIFQEESTIYGGLLKVLFISSDILLFILQSSPTIVNIWSGHLAWPPADFVH